MTFELFEKKENKLSYDGLSVNSVTINFSRKCMKHFAGWKTATIFLDREREVIRFEKSDKGWSIVPIMSCPLSRKMPKGRYYFSHQDNDALIFLKVLPAASE